MRSCWRRVENRAGHHGILALSMAGFALLASDGWSQETALSFSPNAASWADTLTVTAIGNECAPTGLALVSAEDFVVTVELQTFCALADPPFRDDYEFSLALPRLDPGQWTVRLVYESGDEITSDEVYVYHLGDLDIDVEAGTDGAYDVRFRGYTCASSWDLDGEVNDAVFVFDGVCDFGGVPLGSGYQEVLVEDVTLAPGSYRFSVTSDYSPFLRYAASTEFVVPETAPPLPAICEEERFLCLGEQGRFLVTMNLDRLVTQAVTYSARPPTPPSSGFFSLFDADNLEATVKLLDGCAINGHRWFFASWTTTLEGLIDVYDSVTDTRRIYEKPGGTVSLPVADVEAFPCE